MTKLYTRFGFVVGVACLLLLANMMDILNLRPRVGQGQCDVQHHFNPDLPLGQNLRGVSHAPLMFPDGVEVIQGNNQTGRYHTLTLISDRATTSHSWPWHETKQAMEICATTKFDDLGPLPNFSAVICFHDNENISVILHTVHSIVQRTPPELLHEIILIDDHSLKDDLKGILDVYCKANFGRLVKIYRSKKQLGLIQARLKGINLATGEAIAIMDSHVEVQRFWSQPLLYEIRKNRKSLVASYLDWVTPTGTGYEYKHGGTTWKTYFDWGLVFGWQAMSYGEIQQRNNLIKPLRVPVTIGTIYMIERAFFHEVGAFDEGMQLWGGENLDLPVRIWMCGGQVLQHPCSRAGHIEFPKGRDYRRAWDDTIHKNYKRFAEVWMGDYKKYIYQHYPELVDADVGDLSSRLALKDKCPHDFEWYLNTIIPELGVPDKKVFGHSGLRNEGTNLCLHSLVMYAGIWDCESKPSTQGFFWNLELELRFPIHIFKAANLNFVGKNGMGIAQDEFTSYHQQNRSDIWIHWKGGPLYNQRLRLCADNYHDRELRLLECTLGETQLWSFTEYSQDYYSMISGEDPKFKKQHHLIMKAKAEINEQIKEGGKKNDFGITKKTTAFPSGLLQHHRKRSKRDIKLT